MQNRIALFIPTLEPGGILRVALDLHSELKSRGYDVEIVVAKCENRDLERLRENVRVVNLNVRRVRSALIPLARYLRENSPDAMLSASDPGNVIAIAARALAQVDTRLAISCHQTVTNIHAGDRRLFHTFMPRLMRLTYRYADTIIAVSEAIADEVSGNARIPRSKIRVIYNLIRLAEIRRLAELPPMHPWFGDPDSKVILGVGRLTPQKNFSDLIRAFDILRKTISAKLVILGEGSQRAEMEELVHSLGLEECVSLPGYTDNPYPYMRGASVFVSTSHAEAFGIAVVEALVCGTPVVATDCPGGLREVLDHGRLGTLVKQGDTGALAGAIIQKLGAEKPTPREIDEVVQRSDPDRCTEAYLAALGFASLRS